jgi:hypothetical protein
VDVRPWQAIPPPPAPPSLPPYGYLIPVQPRPPGVPPGYWQVPLAPPPPRRRRRWVAWVAAGVAALSAAVPVLASLPQHAAADSGGLRSVTAISAAPWTAEFVDDSGLPARWDPCQPIHYVVDLANAPSGAMSDVQVAIGRLSTATGMTFVLDGTTKERASRTRPAYQPKVYGNGWAPILIAWSSAAGTDLLSDPTSEAVTVPVAVKSAGGTGGGSIVTAEIVLNTARQLPVGFGPGPSEGEVLMHELGHVVGLGHVDSKAEAMFPSVRGVARYGPGDLAGFAAVGLPAGCHAAPAAHPVDALPAAQG